MTRAQAGITVTGMTGQAADATAVGPVKTVSAVGVERVTADRGYHTPQARPAPEPSPSVPATAKRDFIHGCQAAASISSPEESRSSPPPVASPAAQAPVGLPDKSPNRFRNAPQTNGGPPDGVRCPATPWQAGH